MDLARPPAQGLVVEREPTPTSDGFDGLILEKHESLQAASLQVCELLPLPILGMLISPSSLRWSMKSACAAPSLSLRVDENIIGPPPSYAIINAPSELLILRSITRSLWPAPHEHPA